ncbi:hypothetical protein [Enterococcus faecium]|uniref:hypothetical protein n=1 Tax=Enterococcus faecium TaxID=1352 RepID=UPI003F7ACBE2
MYTYEERKKAVDLYFKYDQALTATTKKLGYPSVGALRQWIREFQGIPVSKVPRSNGVNKIQGKISSGNFKIYLTKNTLNAIKTFGIGALGKIIPGGAGWLLSGLFAIISADSNFKHGRVFVYQNYRYQYWYNQ